jgi:heat shock protein HslJ/uncharacterized lipoprotein YbaY
VFGSLIAAFLATANASDAASPGPAPAEITGTVVARGRTVFPSGSLLHVQLLDVSREGTAPAIVAETSLFAGSQRVTIPFAIPYAAAAIDPNHRYVLRAAIATDGSVRFASDVGQAVLTNGAATHADLTVVPAGSPQAAQAPNGVAPSAAAAAPGAQASPTAAGPVRLEGTHWKLVELGGAPSATRPDVPVAYVEFQADKRIAAIGGCNRLMGTYALQGAALSISAGGMTMMACPDPLDKQEVAFTDALRATSGYRITNDALELLDGSKVLARFVAVAK